MAETVWQAKDPDETVAFSDDWTDELAGDTVADWTFEVLTGGCTVSKSSLSARTFTYWIAGGTDDTTSTFQNTVTTGSGQVLIRTFSLHVAAGTNSFHPTSTTKRALVEQMFAQSAILGWELDITADEKDMALTRLDMLMWELRGRGYELGYNFPTAIGDGDLDDDLGCPDQAFFGLSIILAERIAPTFGKTQSKETRIALTDARKAVYSAAAQMVPTMRFATGTPIGSGNKPGRYPYVING